MVSFERFWASRSAKSALWCDTTPIRDEIFGLERLEQHAVTLAEAQTVTDRPPAVSGLRARLDDNAVVLLAAYRTSAVELENDRDVVPAAEWLLDNYHLVEAQIREIREDLPPGFYRQLPKLADGPFAGYPRVFGLAWAFVAHTDSHFDPETLKCFLAAYQRVQPLQIGELWAVAITLRIVLVENLRRLTDRISIGLNERRDAASLASRLIDEGAGRTALDADIAARAVAPLSELFAAELAKLLRSQDPLTTPALAWLTERLATQGSTIEDVVQHSQQRLGASNVSVRNVITSMRLISDINWGDLFESVCLVDAALNTDPGFAAMDFASRNLYRDAIEALGRGSSALELEITDRALVAARSAAAGPAADPGFHLIGQGRRALEQAIAFRTPPRLRLARMTVALGLPGYGAAIILTTAMLLVASLWIIAAPPTWLLLVFAIAAVLPASEVATALVNRAVASGVGAVMLPGLELADGIPPTLRTLVAIPTMLSSEADILEQIEALEVHHLSGSSGDLSFVLVLDGVDSTTEVLAGDAEMLAVALAAIDALNERYGEGPAGQRFWLLHRRRVFSASENCWMGWERKRGKLHEMNRLLRGADDTSFIPVSGRPPQLPDDVRYVITLDADTRMPRDAAVRLVGKMAHPLNQAQFTADGRRITGGYAILQPRVTPSLNLGNDGSLFQKISSGPAGLDPYAAAISDVYQDLFGEGSYTGKGIYDVDAYEAALAGRVPDDALLSHDLFEGVFARAGLASDVEVVEDFPSRYDVAAMRLHRWTRGDWQLAPWVFDHRSGPQALSPLGRWKMADNLRRSLLAPATVLAFATGLFLTDGQACLAAGLLFGSIAIPALLPVVFALVPRHADIRLRNHLAALADDLGLAAQQTGFATVTLADRAWRMGDAVIRTIWRLAVTHRHMLEWTTAAQAGQRPRLDVKDSYRDMVGGLALALLVLTGAAWLTPTTAPLAFMVATLWLAGPAVAWFASRPPRGREREVLAADDATSLRQTARRTWRFFETFVTPLENDLPPDNFQETPHPVIAHRTSPTNIGLYLLSVVAARDFGWLGTLDAVSRLEATLATMARLPRHRGHFFNWYETRDLRVLEPAYVSSVDSGNLAGHLIALANACEMWRQSLISPHARSGVGDALDLACEALAENPRSQRAMAGRLKDIARQLVDGEPLAVIADAATQAAADVPGNADDLSFWLEAVVATIQSHSRDPAACDDPAAALEARLQAVADAARSMSLAMDFGFLLDPDRKLMSIGYSLTANVLDGSCYDLLASEARLASLFAIAKGDVPTAHWFHLGRVATPLGRASALISWSGSMFEYLMPSLVMRAPEGSLLEQTNRLVVDRQRSYALSVGVPWGISESAYNARDLELTYQYSNFGVPGLGLKRGLSENLVVAPYATGLAAMVDAEAAVRNYEHLTKLGALGRYGFFEALDFTRSRLSDGATVAIVRNVMAHHQGMTIVAIFNTLHSGRMRAYFHREPMIQSCALLLQERMPRDVAIGHPRAEEVNSAAAEAISRSPAVRTPSPVDGGPPVTHLLSSGAYAIMVTATGSGYSRWHNLAITRWREDVTRDDWGSFVVLRDVAGGPAWSATAKPMVTRADSDSVVFAEHHATFVRHHGSMTTTTEVMVAEDGAGEVRRVTLTNAGRRTRIIEATSFAELVLSNATADTVHPSFAKMFVETEYLAEYGALIATRRPREPHEQPVWVAHLCVVEGDAVGEQSHETDRAAFLGRGRDLANAQALVAGARLSNSVGTVLDPAFALRQQVRVAPGKLARLAFWTLVAASREELLQIIERHRDPSGFERTQTLAWTQAQVQLRHLGVSPNEAGNFQRLAAPLLYSDPRFRPASATIERGAGSQSGLWPLSISGDRPIIVLRIDDVEDMGQVRKLLRANEYWRMKRLDVDVVIINEHAASYLQDLQSAIETAVRSDATALERRGTLTCGEVRVLRADLMAIESRELLLAVARVVLSARRGPLDQQLNRLFSLPVQKSILSSSRSGALVPSASAPVPNLEFFNGIGGFDRNGTEYVTVLENGASTPAPWVNVIANPEFGMQVSAEGSGYTWAQNSRENQLTSWSNDPVRDPPGEAIYIRDTMSGAVFSATALPVRDAGRYVARHGFGYSRFEHEADGIAVDLLHFVPLADPLRISRVRLTNRSDRARQLSVTTYAEWVLGTARGMTAPFIITAHDAQSGALTARNPWNAGFADRLAFACISAREISWTGDRTEFLGRNGAMAAPAALMSAAPLSGRTGAGLDPCAALQCVIDLAPGESVDVVILLGQTSSLEAARELVVRYGAADIDAELARVTEHWSEVLGTVQVRTPDRAMDIMLNGWLLYQTIACRIWARAGFYQASGAYGFRDQLQDGMALSLAKPEETRRHLLRAAGRQFPEGDVQHWWLPHTGQGVRTRISDDRIWLAFATANYVTTSGDDTVLDEVLPFLDGPLLVQGEADSFFQPLVNDETATLFEHCARGLDQCLELTGALGLPLIGSGDWNDGMNRVGADGRGESVWLGWLLIRTVAMFAPLADSREPDRARRWRAHAESVRAAIEATAWDGEWYRRATFDDGAWLGTSTGSECQIDSIAQSWAVLSGAAEPLRARQAMASFEAKLVRHDPGLALLFTPPFGIAEHDPGYIKGYPPGLRENGGQYSHAAMWAILAYAELDDGDCAANLFALLNPINHALTEADAGRYRVEPYVVAADVYSVAPHEGRGGWTWYTGAAGWMYRAGVEGILGIRRAGKSVTLAPVLPDSWPGFSATISVGATRCLITVTRGPNALASLDGLSINTVSFPLDGQSHKLDLQIETDAADMALNRTPAS
ncbi:glycosyl transferase [Erythromicrobium ramosum]|uniref:Glycosyl transferase n=1 Tax=Erythrobacter ramosus TaxID=35811 RepID=A0A6I4ULK8_9SPHN|nr:glycosyl transferase [Erythrobacter ramosus]